MFTVLQIADSALFTGLAYALVALGLALSFRVLDFPDLTVDGSFALGGAVSAACIASGMDPWVSLGLAIIAGFLSGTATGIFHTRLRISKLLSGILMMMILYSVSLAVMGRSNVSLLNSSTVVTPFERLDSLLRSLYPDLPYMFHPAVIGFLLLLVLAIKVLLDTFLQTEVGLCLRAIGNSNQFAISMAIDNRKYVVFGLGLANGIVALSGGMVAQSQGFADVGMGTGMIIVALAGIIIGETLLSRLRDHLAVVGFLTLAAIAGTIVYQLLIVVCLRLGLPPTYLKLATGIMVVAAISLRFRLSPDFRSKEMYAE